MSDPVIELLQLTIRRQSGRIEELEEELRQVRAHLTSSVSLPRWVPHLSPKEEEVLRHFLSRDTITIEGLRYALYQGQARDEHIVHVWICKLRRKLNTVDVPIETIWGRGYSIPKEFRDLIVDPLSLSPAQSRRPLGGGDNDHDRNATRDVLVPA